MRRFIKTVNDSHCCCCCCRYSLLALTRSQRRVKQTLLCPPLPPYPCLLLVTVLNARVCPFGGTNLSLRLPLSFRPSPLPFNFSLPVSHALSFIIMQDHCQTPLTFATHVPPSIRPVVACPPYYVPKRFPAQRRRFCRCLVRPRPALPSENNNKKKRKQKQKNKTILNANFQVFGNKASI